MPILPIVDLLILLASGSLVVGFLLKAVALATIYRPTLLGFSPADFVLIAGICMLLALVMVARTWLKLHEPSLLALQSRLRHEQARQHALDVEHASKADEAPTARAAGAGRS
ncbi:MAG: hypothetical protein ACQGVC_13870 [Myxococcota bacterium]